MEKRCKDLVRGAFKSRMSDIRKLFAGKTIDGCTLAEYGLSIDVVEKGTFSRDQKAYKRYQLSWGGPSEEFRVYPNEVQFWYFDWLDGAYVRVQGRDAEIIREIVANAQ